MSLSLSLLAFTSMSLFLRLLLPHTPHMHYFKGKKFKIARHRPHTQRSTVISRGSFLESSRNFSYPKSNI